MRPPTGHAYAPLAVLAVLALVLPTLTALPARAAALPNIVLIVTDDQDVRSLKQMPNVHKRIERMGTSFSNFLVSTPGCCPSRASILRGQYTHNHGVLFSDPTPGGSGPPDGGWEAFHDLGLERSTVATWLQARNYRTALVGKYLNGYGADGNPTTVPLGWSEWYASTSVKYFDYEVVENGRVVHYGNDPKDYLTDVLSRKARDFVRRAREDRKPFFLYLAPRAPHDPATPAPRHEGKFTRTKAPRVPSFNEDDVSDKPAYVRDAPRLSRDDIRWIDAEYRDRLRSLQAVDEMVGDLFETLKNTNALDDTYVFFTSDNGYLLGEHRRAGKGMPYEESIRVPLLVRGPGVRAGVVDALASNIDLAPTIAELARVDPAEVPDFVDGRSLVPLLRGKEPERWREATLVLAADRREPVGFVGEVGDEPRNPGFAALRLKDRVYVEYPRTGERELYDLRDDPYQLTNLAPSADPADLERLSAWLAALVACGSDPDDATTCAAAENGPPALEDAPTNRDPTVGDARAGGAAPSRG